MLNIIVAILSIIGAVVAFSIVLRKEKNFLVVVAIFFIIIGGLVLGEGIYETFKVEYKTVLFNVMAWLVGIGIVSGFTSIILFESNSFVEKINFYNKYYKSDKKI